MKWKHNLHLRKVYFPLFIQKSYFYLLALTGIYYNKINPTALPTGKHKSMCVCVNNVSKNTVIFKECIVDYVA